MREINNVTIHSHWNPVAFRKDGIIFQNGEEYKKFHKTKLILYYIENISFLIYVNCIFFKPSHVEFFEILIKINVGMLKSKMHLHQ